MRGIDHEQFRLLHFLASTILLICAIHPHPSLIDFLIQSSSLEKYGTVVIVIILVADIHHYLTRALSFAQKKLIGLFSNDSAS